MQPSSPRLMFPRKSADIEGSYLCLRRISTEVFSPQRDAYRRGLRQGKDKEKGKKFVTSWHRIGTPGAIGQGGRTLQLYVTH
jgi:hypothetical protein